VTQSSAGIAVVVPVYNRPRTVLGALESVLRQTTPPERLIVVDDGSNDATPQALAAWRDAARAPFAVEIARVPHAGAAGARNAGIARSDGARYLAFLDSDDRWPEDFLARTHALLEAEPGAVACSCDQRDVRARGRGVKLRRLEGIAADAPTWLFSNHGGIASATLLRADVVRGLGGFPVALPTGQDLALFLQVSLAGRWLFAAGAAVTMLRGHGAAPDEEGSLASKYPDNHRRWAQIREDFLRAGGGRAVPGPVARRQLAWRWRRAGRQLLRQGRVEEARDCFRRSCAWRAWNRAWLRLALSYVQAPR
jgi:glycosyltransferase involved in cell wall biosynthesis